MIEQGWAAGSIPLWCNILFCRPHWFIHFFASGSHHDIYLKISAIFRSSYTSYQRLGAEHAYDTRVVLDCMPGVIFETPIRHMFWE